jgi:biopolymer transport protein ExbD
MAMDLGGAKGGVKSDINVTPLCDVMLVLLIIMMIVAPLLQQGVNVKLPVAGNTSDKPETQDQTVVAISRDKTMYLNAKPIQEGDLGTKINELLESKKEMAAMDQLRQAGVEDIGLITDPKKGAPGSAGGK